MLDDTPETYKNKIIQGLLAMKTMGLITDDIFDNFNLIISNTWNNGNFQKVFNDIQSKFVMIDKEEPHE